MDVPPLAVHGTGDRILPTEVTAQRLPGRIEDLKLIAVEGGRTASARPTPKKSTPPC
jgi:hypothetical protein